MIPLKPPPVPRFRRAFTLIELSVCVVILLILGSLVIASIGNARKSARSLKCQTNLRQIGVAMQAYAAENNQCYPKAFPQGNSTWMWKLKPYIGMSEDSMGFTPLPKAAGVFICPEYQPEGRNVSYALNAYLEYITAWDSRVLAADTATTIIVVEADGNIEKFSPYQDGDVSRRHPAHSANYLFGDGHVENIIEPIPYDDPRWNRTPPNS